jgi:hypothetical protein
MIPMTGRNGRDGRDGRDGRAIVMGLTVACGWK